MRNNVLSLRPLIASAGLALAALAAPVQAFADDEARRAILDLRQQVQQQNEQNQRARLQLADQIQALQQEVANCATSSNSYPASSPAPGRRRGRQRQPAWRECRRSAGTGRL